MSLASTRHYPSRSAGEATTLAAAILNPQFVVVAAFCAIGLLATLNLMQRVPDLAAFLY